MARVRDLPVPTGPASDEAALAESTLHVERMGLPWEERANLYIAGHRIGFEGENSHLISYDLDALRNGDEFILVDADSTRYTYRVLGASSSAPPTTMSPCPRRKNVVSLQMCTPIPTLAERLVVQDELSEVAPK